MVEPPDYDESTMIRAHINNGSSDDSASNKQHQPKSVDNEHHQKQIALSEELAHIQDSDGSESYLDGDSVREQPYWAVAARKREQARDEALVSLLNTFKVNEAPRCTFDAPHSLCSSCATIDFDKVFFDANIWTSIDSEALKLHPITGIPVHVIPRLDPDMMDSPCPLCRILATMVYGSETESLKVENDSLSWHLRALIHPVTQQVTVYLTEHWENVHEGFGRSGTKWYESIRRGRLLPCLPDILDPVELQIHQPWEGHVHEDRVDYPRVRQMLQDCERDHEQACTESLLDHPAKARVIDCKDRVVVPLTTDVKYIALSYVWGPHPQLQPQSIVSTEKDMNDNITMRWSLPEHLPQTIEDSIAIVKGLGLQYLWVDRYCIQQVHATDKQFQISQMAKIYGAAYATICALGDHDDCGLHGVSLPRRPNSFVDYNKHKVVKVADPQRIKTYIKESVWHQRGWTFQEIFLSRRALFFTSEETFMVCKEMCTSEGLIVSPGDEHGREVKIEPDRLFWPASTYQKRAETIPIFEKQVQEYQTRTLKFKSDMLFAFEGLLSVQELSTIMGVPVMKLPPERYDSGSLIRYGFAYGLAWHNISTGPLQHSTGCDELRCGEFGCWGNYVAHFPSWSWVCRSRVRTRFEYFTRPGRPKFKPRIGAPHGAIMDILYCADISIQTAAAKIQSITEFLKPFISSHQDKAITGDLRHLHIKSVIAQWRDTGDQVEMHIQDRGLSRLSKSRVPYWLDYEGGNGGWLGIDNRPFWGILRLDYKDIRKKRGKGLAVLLFATGMKGGAQACGPNAQGTNHGRLARTVWLVIRDVGDGTYCREGLIESHGYMRPSAARKAAQGKLVTPSNLRTIILG